MGEIILTAEAGILLTGADRDHLLTGDTDLLLTLQAEASAIAQLTGGD